MGFISTGFGGSFSACITDVVEGKSIERIEEKEISFLLTETFITLEIETVDFARLSCGFVRVDGGVFGGEIRAETILFGTAKGPGIGAETKCNNRFDVISF